MSSSQNSFSRANVTSGLFIPHVGDPGLERARLKHSTCVCITVGRSQQLGPVFPRPCPGSKLAMRPGNLPQVSQRRFESFISTRDTSNVPSYLL